jgi:hypothetical protein
MRDYHINVQDIIQGTDKNIPPLAVPIIPEAQAPKMALLRLNARPMACCCGTVLDR